MQTFYLKRSIFTVWCGIAFTSSLFSITACMRPRQISTLCMRTYFGGLLVCEDLRVDSVELQNEFVHQLRVKSPVSSEEGAVLYQLLMKTVCACQQRDVLNND